VRDITFTEEDFRRMEHAMADALDRVYELFRVKNHVYFGAFFKCDTPKQAFGDIERKFIRAKSIIDNNGAVLSPENKAELAETMLDLADYSLMFRVALGAEDSWRPKDG
jgi:hypothetical protein